MEDGAREQAPRTRPVMAAGLQTAAREESRGRQAESGPGLVTPSMDTLLPPSSSMEDQAELY